MLSRRPNQFLLVTGVPRSGTTFVGRCMALAPTATYLWEPFNQKYRSGIPDYYPYIGPSTDTDKISKYNSIISDTLMLRHLSPFVEVRPGDGLIRRIVKSCGINRSFFQYRYAQAKQFLNGNRCLLIKDPVAIFLSEHLLRNFNFKIIAVVRHPAAVACSRERLNWGFGFDAWSRQDDLTADLLTPFFASGVDYASYSDAEMSALQWRLCYGYLKKLEENYKDKLLLVRHEDLLINPREFLNSAFEFANLEFDEQVLRKVNHYMTGTNVERKTMQLSRLERRNANELRYAWKTSIEQSELNKIRDIAGQIAEDLYSTEKDWKL